MIHHITAVSSILSTYRIEPYPNQTLETNFSKSTRQKLKVKVYSNRTRVTL